MELQALCDAFRAHQRKAHAYAHAMGLLGYDANAHMPVGGRETAGDTLAVLSEAAYRLDTDPAYIAMLEELCARASELDYQTRREAEELLREQRRLSAVPQEEHVAFTVAQNAAEAAWLHAKETDDFAHFLPHLEQMIAFRRRWAGYVAPEADPYDTLLDSYERGLTREKADAFFVAVRGAVAPLAARIAGREPPRSDFLSRPCPIEGQRALSRAVMELMGLDPRRCTIGETEHPFTTEFSKNDVRITTHYYEDQMLSNLFSVIHEGGHALYELNIGDELLHSALGHGTSMGVHESQSRFWENSIGRSEAFCRLIFPRVKELFPAQMGDVTAGEFYRGVNRVQPSLIRIEADELTYPLHILVRYELEKELIAGTLAARELPEAWNALYREVLGVTVPSDREGVLQDTHWSGGSFGYFPSYAIGSAYAAQMTAALERELPLWELVAHGELAPIADWLTARVYRHGALIGPEEAVYNCCGEAFDAQYYIDYLTRKFSALYAL